MIEWTWCLRVSLHSWLLSVFPPLVWFHWVSEWTPGRRLDRRQRNICTNLFSDGFSVIWWRPIPRLVNVFHECLCAPACHQYRSKHFGPHSTCSINCWKLAGHPSWIMGDMIQWNWSHPGIMNAVNGCNSSSSFICQNLEVRSSDKKIVELACPLSQMHSLISFMEYLSVCEWRLSCRKSWIIWIPWPCFLGTQKMGELYREQDFLTTLSLSHSSRVWSMNWLCASSSLNCLQ